jgi:hypothetical protein
LNREGNLIWPTLLDDVTPEMRIAWEEPFGPVLPIVRVDTVQQAIDHCNASKFGLQVRSAPLRCGDSSGFCKATSSCPAAGARGPFSRLLAQINNATSNLSCSWLPINGPNYLAALLFHLLAPLVAFVPQGCVFTQDINQAIAISDAMETGTVQVQRD